MSNGVVANWFIVQNNEALRAVLPNAPEENNQEPYMVIRIGENGEHGYVVFNFETMWQVIQTYQNILNSVAGVYARNYSDEQQEF